MADPVAMSEDSAASATFFWFFSAFVILCMPKSEQISKSGMHEQTDLVKLWMIHRYRNVLVQSRTESSKLPRRTALFNSEHFFLGGEPKDEKIIRNEILTGRRDKLTTFLCEWFENRSLFLIQSDSVNRSSPRAKRCKSRKNLDELSGSAVRFRAAQPKRLRGYLWWEEWRIAMRKGMSRSYARSTTASHCRHLRSRLAKLLRLKTDRNCF